MDAYIHEAALRGDTFTILFSGCNFKCPFCNQPKLVEFRTEEQMALRDVKALLDAISAKSILFSGGEPLLQRQALLELATHAKKRGFRVQIETNASKPDTLKPLLDAGVVDELIVDLKGAWPRFEKVAKAGTFFQPAGEVFEDVQKSLALLRAYDNIDLKFKTVVTPGLIYKKEDILAIAQQIKAFGAQWYLVPFDAGITLDPALRGVAPPTQGFLENLALFAQQAYPRLKVKVAESATKLD